MLFAGTALLAGRDSNAEWADQPDARTNQADLGTPRKLAKA